MKLYYNSSNLYLCIKVHIVEYSLRVKSLSNQKILLEDLLVHCTLNSKKYKMSPTCGKSDSTCEQYSKVILCT